MCDLYVKVNNMLIIYCITYSIDRMLYVTMMLCHFLIAHIILFTYKIYSCYFMCTYEFINIMRWHGKYTPSECKYEFTKYFLRPLTQYILIFESERKIDVNVS